MLHDLDGDSRPATDTPLPRLLVKQMVQMKNRISGLLMETGVSYNKQRLHKVGYFTELMSGNEDINC